MQDCGDRTFLVLGFDDQGDAHLFSTADRERAERKYRQYLQTLQEVRVNCATSADPERSQRC